LNDQDGDGRCEGADNCATLWNAMQLDSDGDGIGDLCDNCPDAPNDDQADTDSDGRGNVCDCESTDYWDLSPGEVPRLRPFKSGTTATFGWFGPGTSSGVAEFQGANVFSVTRGLLSALRSTGTLGPCFAQGLSESVDDAALLRDPGDIGNRARPRHRHRSDDGITGARHDERRPAVLARGTRPELGEWREEESPVTRMTGA
jgi:hypothetical protein